MSNRGVTSGSFIEEGDNSATAIKGAHACFPIKWVLNNNENTQKPKIVSQPNNGSLAFIWSEKDDGNIYYDLIVNVWDKDEPMYFAIQDQNGHYSTLTITPVSTTGDEASDN